MSNIKAVIETSKGTINLNLYTDETPVTSANFINLATRGYYNDLMFHRVLPDFMIQGGCPDGNGMGGPGYRFEDECKAELCHDKPGILSMANAGPGTNGSQFFITHTPTDWLDGKHTVFGCVVSEADQEIVDVIEQGDAIKTIVIEGDYQPVLDAQQARLDEWNPILDANS
ncbi:MAG: peptidylprolyl isomerase [Fibrobacterales bacterium]